MGGYTYFISRYCIILYKELVDSWILGFWCLWRGDISLSQYHADIEEWRDNCIIFFTSRGVRNSIILPIYITNCEPIQVIPIRTVRHV